MRPWDPVSFRVRSIDYDLFGLPQEATGAAFTTTLIRIESLGLSRGTVTHYSLAHDYLGIVPSISAQTLADAVLEAVEDLFLADLSRRLDFYRALSGSLEARIRAADGGDEEISSVELSDPLDAVSTDFFNTFLIGEKST